MLRLGIRSSNVVTKRGFRSSVVRMNDVYGTPKSGPYSNLPFQVKDRKYIPFPVYYWSILTLFFAFPFLTSWWQLKKSGSLAPKE